MLFRRALRHLVSGREHDAEQDLAKIVRDDTAEIEAYLALAEIYRRRGEVGRAITMYQNLNLRGDLGSEQREAVLCGLGLAFETGGFLPRAIATFEEVLAQSSRHVVALAALARMLPRQGDLERALVVQRRWAKTTGERDRAAEAELLVAIARRRLDEGRGDLAQRAARRALKLDPSRYDAHLLQADVERGARRPRREVQHLLDAIEAAPSRADEILPRLEAAWPEGAGRRGAWVDQLRALARTHADEPAFVDALARALASAGQAADALEVLRAGLVRWPEHLALRMREGRILLAGGEYDEALSAYETLLDQLEKTAGIARSGEGGT